MSEVDQEAIEAVAKHLGYTTHCPLPVTKFEAQGEASPEVFCAAEAIDAYLQYLDSAGFAVVRKGSVPAWMEGGHVSTNIYGDIDFDGETLPDPYLYRLKDES